jgi:hypothetical protein
MAAAEKNRLNTISLGLFFYGFLRREISQRRILSDIVQRNISLSVIWTPCAKAESLLFLSPVS